MKYKDVIVQVEGGMVTAIKMPRGIRVQVLDHDTDGASNKEITCEKGCRLSVDPHFHAVQTVSDKWSWEK